VSKPIKVTRFLQEPGYCATAASASCANYYNEDVDYEYAKGIADKMAKASEGLDSPEIGILLNELGFYSVTIVSSDLSYLDYSWKDISRTKLIEELKEYGKKRSNSDYAVAKLMAKFLDKKEYKNELVISHHFGRHIRSFLSKKKPVILSFNWTMMFEFGKSGDKKELDTHKGNQEYHAVVGAGYDKRGVWVVDSHHQYYKYKLKRYRKGIYKISWENLMTVMGQGDVILPGDYYLYE